MSGYLIGLLVIIGFASPFVGLALYWRGKMWNGYDFE